MVETFPDRSERLLEGWQCPLEVMDAWEEGIEHKLVIKLLPQRDYTSGNVLKGKETVKEKNLSTQSIRNMEFFRRTNKTSENETDADKIGENVNFIAANIFTDCDTLYDADESDYSESDISEDEENGKHLTDTSLSTSLEDIVMDNH